MRQLIIILFLLLIESFCYAFSEQDARKIVNELYNSIKIITQGDYSMGTPGNCVNASRNAISLFYKSDIDVPSKEFLDFNFKEPRASMEIGGYIGRYFDFSKENNPKINTEILRVEALEEIKSAKAENSKNFYEVYVKKAISVNTKTKYYTHVVRIVAEDEKISAIMDELVTDNSESVMSLRGTAAKFFAQKKYKEAYDTYLKVIAKDHQQGDAYYRLALMSYHNLGCKNRFKNGKERRQKSYEYILLAIKYGNYDIRKYANNVKYYMENGQV